MKYKDSFNQCKHNSTACETRPRRDGWLSWLARNCGAAPFKYIIDSVWSVQWAEPVRGRGWGQECRALFRGSRRPCGTPAWVALGLAGGNHALKVAVHGVPAAGPWLRNPGAGLEALIAGKGPTDQLSPQTLASNPEDCGGGGTGALSVGSALRTILGHGGPVSFNHSLSSLSPCFFLIRSAFMIY